jgi:hypothetical protein
VLERASQLELSAAQDAPVDELQASVLATLKSQLAEHAAAGSSLRLQADSLGNQPSSSSKTQRIFDVLSKILGKLVRGARPSGGRRGSRASVCRARAAPPLVMRMAV